VSAPWIRPAALRRGDTVGVCAPSGPVDAARLALGVRELEACGYEVRVADGILDRTRFTAGSAERRREQLEGLFADPDVAAIVCARGGAGASALLAGLDLERLRATPKVFVGYSDVTALHLALNNQRIVTFHGPMVAREFADASYDRASFQAAVSGEGAPYRSAPTELSGLHPGSGRGRLLGGCMSLLCAACGTPWPPPDVDDDVILFLEDVSEPAYRVDRMLRQLHAAGAFARVRGLLFGTLPGCGAPDGADFGIEDVIADAVATLQVPVAWGMPSGHTEGRNVTLPLGVAARLDVDSDGQASFEVLEAGVD